MIRAYVGAGGKTSLLKSHARAFREAGQTVLVTTTTHMFMEPDTLLTDDPRVILDALNRTGYAMAGIRAGEKIKALSDGTFRILCDHADVVLVEADGSKHLPIKFPGPGEPVIPENVDEIWIVCGLHALGRPLREVAHRPELVRACLGADDDTIITPEHMEKLVIEGYVNPLRRQFPNAALVVYPAHDGSLAQQEIAARIVKNCTKDHA